MRVQLSFLTLLVIVGNAPDVCAKMVSFCGKHFTPRARHVICHDRNVVEIKKLWQLRQIRKLDLSGTSVKDIRAVRGMRYLKHVDLSKTPVEDISHLKRVKGLERLYLRDCKKITDLSPIKSLTDLQRLDLSGVRLTSLGIIQPLRELRYLALASIPLRTVRSLLVFTELEELDLSWTKLVDLRPLAKLPKLRKLNLSCIFGPQLDLRQLKGAPGLRELRLNATRVTTLAPLTDHPTLYKIWMPDRKVSASDVTILKRLGSLRRMVIENRLIDPAVLQMLKRALPRLKVTLEGV